VRNDYLGLAKGVLPTAFISLCFLGLCAQVSFETWLSSVLQKPQIGEISRKHWILAILKKKNTHTHTHTHTHLVDQILFLKNPSGEGIPEIQGLTIRWELGCFYTSKINK